MGYAPYGVPYGLYQPPPPPPPHPNNLVNPNEVVYGNRGLNVTDPRYAAKYGNPYLRSSEAPGAGSGGSPILGSPHMNPRYPYATLNNRGYIQQNPNVQGFSTMQRPNPAAGTKLNYAGTMVGNGKAGTGQGSPANNRNIVTSSEGGGNNGQYIVSPEADAKNDALATHV
jgi:hypothetical protein